MNGPPPDDAYGRVTDPERFAALHAVADWLVGELTTAYEAEARAGPADSLHPGSAITASRVVELVPADADAASLMIEYTDFPGLRVRFGPWHVEVFPSCGCDACDEQPEELESELRRLVGAVVAGGFTESISGRWLSTEFAIGSGGAHRRQRKLSRQEKRARGGSGRQVWSPWPTRRAQR